MTVMNTTTATNDEITVRIAVTARLPRRRVADLHEAIADAAESFADGAVTVHPPEVRPTGSRRGRPPASENIDRCLVCGDKIPGELGVFQRAKEHGWRRRYYGRGSRFVCPGCP